MTGSHHDVNELLRRLAKAGWQVLRTGGDHWRAEHPDGRRVTLASSPSRAGLIQDRVKVKRALEAVGWHCWPPCSSRQWMTPKPATPKAAEWLASDECRGLLSWLIPPEAELDSVHAALLARLRPRKSWQRRLPLSAD